MSITLYEIYQQGLIHAAANIYIKHTDAAETVNNADLKQAYPVSDNPYTWHYYLNLAGNYHARDLAEISVINGGSSPYMLIPIAGDYGAVDTPFTRALIDPALGGDIAIANEYRYGTKLYETLVNRYPEHVALINGILNPVSPAMAINAKDGEILYASGFYRTFDSRGRVLFTQPTVKGKIIDPWLEPTEINVLYELETWIKRFFFRWYNSALAEIEDMYFGVYWWILHSAIPNIIHNLRLANCHTENVHSFHLKEYLDGFGGLGAYFNQLPRWVLLYLYQNAPYLDANSGHEHTFQQLITDLFTPLQIPVDQYRLRHDLTGLNLNQGFKTVGVKKPLNFKDNATDITYSLEHVLTLEENEAVHNVDNLTEVAAAINERATKSMSDDYPTKIIESGILDISGNARFHLGDILFNHWIFAVTHGVYKGVVYVTHPATGDRLQFTPQSALITLVYLITKCYHHYTPTYLPTLYPSWIRRTNDVIIDNYAGVLSVTDLKKQIYSDQISTETLASLVGVFSTRYQFASVSDFYSYGQSLLAKLTEEYTLVVKQYDMIARSDLDFAMSQQYWFSVPCDLGSTTLYKDWLFNHGLNFDTLSTTEMQTLIDDLVKQSLGLSDATDSNLAIIQTAMLNVMKHFGSYHTQYIGNINTHQIVNVGNQVIRFTRRLTEGFSHFVGELPSTNILDIKPTPAPNTYVIGQLVRGTSTAVTF